MLQFSCPNCHKNLKVAGDAAGRQSTCPSCSQPIRIPDAQPIVQIDESREAQSQGNSDLTFWGIVCVTLGTVVVLYFALFYDVEGGVLRLMQNRWIGVVVGIVLFATGVLLQLAGRKKQ